jgi:hypothetical protein
MFTMRKLFFLGTLAATASACDLPLGACAGVGIDGIVVEVRQPSGESALAGALIVAREGSYADTAGPVVPYQGSRAASAQNEALAENRGGRYTVSVTKPYWTSATQQVRVPGGSCGYVETQHIQMQISQRPGAPPVRSIAIAPRSLRFGFCGSGVAASTYVDANAGIPTAVRWRSENPLVATVSAEGFVSVRSRGITAMVAQVAADTTVSQRMIVQVDPVCP